MCVFEMNSETKPIVSKEDDVWVIRVPKDNGKPQEYRCATEAQALALATVFTPKEKR